MANEEDESCAPTSQIPLGNKKDSQDGWKTVKNQKRDRESPDQQARQPKRPNKITDYWLNKITPTSNPFDVLVVDEQTKAPENIGNIKQVKSPPIFVTGVENIQPLKVALDAIAKDGYNFKISNGNEVRIQPLNSDSYNPIVKMLKEKDTQFYTFQRKQDRNFRVVLKNIHPSVDTEDLKVEIEGHKHTVRSIVNIKHSISKIPLPIFFVEIETKENNKDIYGIKYLQNTVVKFEPPKKKRDIPQCTRCQGFYHTKNYCNKMPKCVKCANHHLTENCPIKEKIKEVVCANCNGNHPASYKGCLVRKQLQQKIYPALREKKLESNFQKQASTVHTNQTKINLTYAQATSCNRDIEATSQQLTTEVNKPSTDNTRLEHMMAQLLTRMDTMLNLLTTVISKIA